MRVVTRRRAARAHSLVVHGQSMAPTVREGATVRAGAARELRRGDVVTVVVSTGRLDLKRIVGLPAERITWDGAGRIWVNRRLLEEPYARLGRDVPGDEERATVTLGPRDYFVVGDQRLYSTDSRIYGPVGRTAIRGVVPLLPL